MWFAPALHLLLGPLHYLQQLFRDHYIHMGEHKAQLRRARLGFKVDLVNMAAFYDKEAFKAAREKQRELGEARITLDRAARALAKRGPY